MRKSEWSDKQLEELLRNMPKIEDNRDPRDIYQNITIKLNKKKQRSWIIPSVASAAAILLFAILTPTFINWNDSAEESMEKSTASESSEQILMDREENKTSIAEDSNNEENMEIMKKESEEEISMSTFEVEESYIALYDTDINNGNVYTFAIPDNQAQNVVPISVVVPKEEGKEAIDQFNETMSVLQEEQWGLSDYYPMNAEISFDERESSLKVNVPTGHIYGDGSAAELAFKEVLEEAANTVGLSKVSLYTDNQPGIEFGNQGNVTDLNVSKDGNRAFYFYYPTVNAEKPYLVPYQQPFNDIEDALDAMKENIDTHGLKASIPEDINIDGASSKEQVLTLQLDEGSQIDNEPSMIYTIEAILLTAKDFKFEKVKIEYNKMENVGKFFFNQELNVPIAPNKMELLH